MVASERLGIKQTNVYKGQRQGRSAVHSPFFLGLSTAYRVTGDCHRNGAAKHLYLLPNSHQFPTAWATHGCAGANASAGAAQFKTHALLRSKAAPLRAQAQTGAGGEGLDL